MFDIRPDDLTGAQTRALLTLHLDSMRANSPPDQAFALDLTGLQSPDVSVWSVWDETIVVGVGALRTLSAKHGELKSMRTHPDHLRRGVGVALLDHIIAAARRKDMAEIFLEIGSGPAFDAALRLYRSYGFTECGPFGSYQKSAFNQFLSLRL